MARKTRTPLVVHESGLYVEVAAIMSPIIPLIDGLPVTFFGKSRKARAYLRVVDAIAWCEAEKQYHDRERYEAVIALLRKFEQQHGQTGSPATDRPAPREVCDG